MTQKTSLESENTKILRRTARVLSLVILVLMVSFVIVYIFFPEHSYSFTNLEQNQLVTILVAALIFIGLALAWKWELIGAMISLIGFIGVGILYPYMLTMPIVYFFPLAAILFIISWWMTKLDYKKAENIHHS